MKRAIGVFLSLSMCLAFFATGAVEAADWPQWRGPDRNGISKESGLLQEWPKEGPALAWKVDKLGGGDSAPTIAGGRIFFMSNLGEDEVVWALSEKDGQTIWKTRLGPVFNQRTPQSKEGPSCSPTVDGEHLYVEGLAGNVVCLRIKDGGIVWQRSLTQDFGGRVPMWSYRESPLVDGDKVICTPGGADAALVALNKLTGETIWKASLGGEGGASYSSVIAIDFEGQRQYVQLLSNTLAGFAASDGKFLWRYDKPANRMGINCSTPLSQDGLVFASSAYGAGGGLVMLSKDPNGGVKAEEVYSAADMQSHHGGMILFGGSLYGATGGNEGGALACLDFETGKVQWDQRATAGRQAKGSLTMAGGRLYYRMENGTVVLIEPSAKEYLERGRFEQPERRTQPAWAHPVVANGKLYIRDQDLLFCYDVKAK
ncbi:MAG TPA: PQQ-like beta-propeller repeat protein [Candidatus Sumerlaeota bacterium]|nr:PQQ-like beta-propeller repeat protein [Candidatus Sumerlaeota bacterium]